MSRILVGAVFAFSALLPAAARADVLVNNYYNSSIERFNQNTGAYLGTFIPSGLGGLVEPAGIVYNPTDNLIYVSSQGNNEILRYNLNGTFNSVFANLSSINSQYGPAGLRFSPTNGDLYVARNLNFFTNTSSAGQGTIDELNKTTGAFVGSPITGMSGANGVMFTSTGDLYGSSFASLTGGGYVAKVPNGGTQQIFIAPGTTTLETAAGLAQVPGTSNLAVVDLLGGSVAQFGPTGTQLANLIDPTNPSTEGQFPSDVMFTSPTMMWVATLGSNDPPMAPNGSVLLFNLASSTPQTPIMTTTGFFAAEFAIAPVPEPGTLLLVGGAAVAGFVARRRRR
jgi:PEP-CTERM motif